MVFTNSGMAMPMGQNIGGARVPEPVGNYRCWSQMAINDWNTPEEQDKMTGDWGKDVAGRGKRSSLTVGDINGAYPKTYGGAWRFPGDREQCIAQGRPMDHLKEENFQRRVPVRHQAARTARGGWTAADAINAQVGGGKLVHPTTCSPPKHWAPSCPEGSTSNSIIKTQFKYHQRNRRRLPEEQVPMCADPTLAHTNAKGGSMPKPSIRARKLGSMALSADTNIGQGEMPEGTGVLAYGQHAQYEHGAGRRIAKAGRRAGRVREGVQQPSPGKRLRELQEANSAKSHEQWSAAEEPADGMWLGKGPAPKDSRRGGGGVEPAGKPLLSPLSRTAAMYAVNNGQAM